MLTRHLSHLYQRELTNVKEEIAAYKSEDALWVTSDGINNSAGNLSLHISGNLQHFFGTILGGTDYERDRDFEFSGKVSRQELLDDLEAAEKAITDTLAVITEEQLDELFPVKAFGEVTTEWFILHLYGHLTYHLGQINYHRRWLDK
ncbi:MAG: DUF1572 domain-containing protein [bacterium]|nr:DUF1572 domain-containing protein [bacterium]